jgi:hypothetical protein
MQKLTQSSDFRFYQIYNEYIRLVRNKKPNVMKTLTLLAGIFLLSFSSSDVLAKCYLQQTFYIGDSQYHSYQSTSYTFHLDTSVSSSQVISIPIHYYGAYVSVDGCDEWVISYSWKKNGVFVSTAQIYTVTDTGFYEGQFSFSGGSQKSATLHVGHLVVTSINELNTDTKFSFYPSHSSGIFQIKSEQALTNIMISDNMGREVFNTSENLSSINISGLPKGVYFYYVEDKFNRAYKGRIIKD